MNILLIGEKYSSNLGDGVICEIMHRQHGKQRPVIFLQNSLNDTPLAGLLNGTDHMI
jgi:hypothetical protein